MSTPFETPAPTYKLFDLNAVALSFVVGQAVWDNPALIGQFENIVHQAAPSVGELPRKLRLLNTSLETKKTEEIN